MALSTPSTVVGNPRYGASSNPFVAGNPTIGARQSYLAQIGGPGSSSTDGQFKLPDGSSVPTRLLEDRLTQSLTDTVRGLIDKTLALHQAAGSLLSGTPSTRDPLRASPLVDISIRPTSRTLPEPGIFSRRVATSSDSAVQVSARDNATPQTYQVEVVSLETTTTTAATPQQNVGTQILSATTSPPDFTTSNAAQIIITSAVGTTTIRFNGGNNIRNSDTNLDALNTIASAINSSAAGADISAVVTTSGSYSRLNLTSRVTGTAGAFTIVDDASTPSNIVAVSGVGTATTAAADATTTTTPAVVRINGVQQDAASGNQLGLDAQNSVSTNRLNLFFKAVTSSPVTVGVTAAVDANQVVDASKKLASAANNLRAYISDKADILSQGLVSRLDAVMGSLKEPLASIGISQDKRGAISVDESKLRRALSERPNEVERTIGYVNGFASSELSVANAILHNPGIAFAGRGGGGAQLEAQASGAGAQFSEIFPSGLLVNRRF